jgi:ubiquinone biosynthesis protein
VGHGFTGFAGFILLIVVLVVAGGRLLGVRLSWSRALLVGFGGLVAGYVFAFLVTRRPGQLSPLVVVAAVVATMLLTVLAELVARPGARPRRTGPPRPWRALHRMGQRIRRYGQLARIAARHGLARELLTCLLRQILVQGTFHADPHPGNVMLLDSGDLALIDFGSVGRLDVRQQAALRRLLTAIAQRDPAELYEAVTELAIAPVRDEEFLEQTLAAFMTEHLRPGMVADAAMIRDLFTVLAQAGAAFPPVIAGVFRALITLDGTLRTLAPGFDMVAEAQSVARQLAGDQFAPKSLRAAAATELLTLLPMLRKLPRRADRISTALAQGRLTTNLRLFSDPRDVSVVTTLVNRAVLGLLGAALGVMSVLLLQVRASPAITKGTSTLQLFGYVGLFLSVTLILRVAIDILRPRR